MNHNGRPQPQYTSSAAPVSQSQPSSHTGPSERPRIDQAMDELDAFIGKFLVCSKQQRTVLVLWIVYTYCFNNFPLTPYLEIFSPETQSSKTVCLRLLQLPSIQLHIRLAPDVQVGTNGPEVGTMEGQVGTNLQPETANPNVFNTSAEESFTESDVSELLNAFAAEAKKRSLKST